MIRLVNIEPHPLREMPGGIGDASSVFGTICEFEKGRRYLIPAASGRGKSTLLHIIYGLRKDYNGEVLWDGRPVAELSAGEWAGLRQRHLSIVFQDLRLFPELTAMENLVLKAGLTGSVGESTLQEWADRLDVKPFLDKKCGVLSYGQRQRFSIIRALCQPFDFLLLDEPFSHLDEQNTQLAAGLIEEVSRSNKAGILLSDLDAATPMPMDRVMPL